MKKLFNRHPILTGIVASLVVYFGAQLLSIPFVIIGELFSNGDEKLFLAINYLATAIGAILILLLFKGINRKHGFKGVFGASKTNQKDIHTSLLFVLVADIGFFIYSTILLNGGFKALVLPNFYTFSLALCAGIMEETAFRAIPGALMMKNDVSNKHIITTVITTSFLFGLIHFSNMLEGAILSTTIIQVIGAFTFGTLCVAVYLRSGSIFIPIAFHFFHDLMNFMLPAQSTGVMTQTSYSVLELIPEISMMAIELGIGIYLLRKIQLEDVRTIWTYKWSKE